MTAKFDELLALEGEELLIALHRLEQDSDAVTPFERGFLNGKLIAESILDLTDSTEMKQNNGGWMPDIRPATVMQRRGWLRGYAHGILAVTDDPEAQG